MPEEEPTNKARLREARGLIAFVYKNEVDKEGADNGTLNCMHNAITQIELAIERLD